MTSKTASISFCVISGEERGIGAAMWFLLNELYERHPPPACDLSSSLLYSNVLSSGNPFNRPRNVATMSVGISQEMHRA